MARAYRGAEALAREAHDEERAAAAAAFARALEENLSTLAVRLPEPSAELRLAIDGRPVPAAEIAGPRPIDPGVHRIAVVAPGDRRWSREVTVGTEADHRVVTVPPIAEWVVAATEPASAPEPAPDGLGGLQIAAIVLTGAGGVSLVVGAVLGGLALADESSAADACPDERCPGVDSVGRGYVESARSEALASDITLAAGGAAVVLGVIGIVAGSIAADDDLALRFAPAVGGGIAGAVVRGRF
jgi:hypothetical protein